MSVVTRDEAKTHLNITSTTYDTELQTFLDRVEAAIAKRVGPLTSTTKTDRVRGLDSVLFLRYPPVISLTSVTAIEGTVVDIDQLTPTVGGRVEWKAFGYFPSRFYDVVYQSGWATVPDDLKLGVLEILRRYWGSSQRGQGRQGSRLDEPQLAQLIDSLTQPFVPVLGR